MARRATLPSKNGPARRGGEGDLRTALMQIGKFSDWSVKPNAEFFDYEEKKNRVVTAEASGWQTPRRRYAFVYVADVPGDVGLLPDKTAIDQKFPFS